MLPSWDGLNTSLQAVETARRAELAGEEGAGDGLRQALRDMSDVALSLLEHLDTPTREVRTRKDWAELGSHTPAWLPSMVAQSNRNRIAA